MNITLTDFFTKYPEIDKNTNPLLNPYLDSFTQSLYSKKEFNELKLSRFENVPEEGDLYNHQRVISRFFSSHTPYTGLLLLHEMGTGKTCALFGATEQIKREGIYKRAFILTRNPRLLQNLKHELAYKCTQNIYSPQEHDLTEIGRQHRLTKLTSVFYTFISFDSIKKRLRNMSNEQIVDRFSDSIFGIDEVHNLKLYGEGTNQSSEDYNQVHRLLHVAKNIKVLLLSGTPMTDHPNEIAQILNLILPMGKQLPTGDDFTDRFLYTKDGINYIKDESKPFLKQAMTGSVSYLKTMVSDVDIKYEGTVYPGLKLFKIIPSIMSEFQTSIYKESLKKDKETTSTTDNEDSDEEDVPNTQQKKKKKTAGVYSNSRQSTLFVFPNGSYGSSGFTKYVERRESKSVIRGAKTTLYGLSKSLETELKGKDNVETIRNIRKYSATYANTIQSILDNPNKLHFIYGKLIEGSGNILFACLLSLVGYSRGMIDNRPRLSYFNVTKNIYSDDQIKNIIAYYSSPENMTGKFANVLISSKILSEGFTIKNIQEIHVLTPHWNFSELAQAIARGIRLNAHNDLIRAGKKPEIKIYLHVAIPDDNTKSLDLDKYIISERKDVAIKDMERLIKEAAVDCALFRDRNMIQSAKDNSRECEYQACDYKCDGITNYNVPEKDIDYTTYNLYYANKDIERVIEQITQFFGTHFSCYLEDIVEKYESANNTPFVILSAISIMINKNYEIRNRYNIISYLREESNILYLIDTISATSVFSQCSYTKFPAVKDSMSYSEALNDICIGKMCKGKDMDIYLGGLSHFLKMYLCDEVIKNDLASPKIREYFNITDNTYVIDGEQYSVGGVKSKTEKSPTRPKVVMADTIHGYSGNFNDNYFCIKSKSKDVKDTREINTGRMCPSSWKVDQLCKIIVELGIPYGNNEKYPNIAGLDREYILKEFRLFKDTTNKLKMLIDEFGGLDVEGLRRVLYFATSPKQVSCDAIKQYFEANGLLEYSTMCGKPGVKRTKE